MACSSLKQNSFMSPRVSFSNGFAETGGELIRQQIIPAAAVAGTSAGDHFEFSVASYNMNSADELFFNGKLLPLSEENNYNNEENEEIHQDYNLSPIFKNMKVTNTTTTTTTTTTLRDELLVDDYDNASDDHQFSFRARLGRMSSKGRTSSSASACKWKERFNGLKIKSTLL